MKAPASPIFRVNIYDEQHKLNWCPEKVVWCYGVPPLTSVGAEPLCEGEAGRVEKAWSCEQRHWDMMRVYPNPGTYKVRFKIYDDTYLAAIMWANLEVVK